MTRFTMIASGYLMLINDEKILLSRRFQTGYQDGNYSLPAGHIEEGETLTTGTCREVGEEIGLVLEPDQLDLVHIMHRRGEDERLDFFFTVKSWRGEPKNMEPHKCDDLRWFPMQQLPKNTIPYIAAAVHHVQSKQIYSEFGWE